MAYWPSEKTKLSEGLEKRTLVTCFSGWTSSNAADGSPLELDTIPSLLALSSSNLQTP